MSTHSAKTVQHKKLKGRLLEIPLSALASPREGEVMVDRWWAVQDGRALFWQGRGRRHGWSPMCNRDKRVATILTKKLFPGATVEHAPVAYVGHYDQDWGYMLSTDLMGAAASCDTYQAPFDDADRCRQCGVSEEEHAGY